MISCSSFAVRNGGGGGGGIARKNCQSNQLGEVRRRRRPAVEARPAAATAGGALGGGFRAGCGGRLPRSRPPLRSFEPRPQIHYSVRASENVNLSVDYLCALSVVCFYYRERTSILSLNVYYSNWTNASKLLLHKVCG